jgi:hypothetical protein
MIHLTVRAYRWIAGLLTLWAVGAWTAEPAGAPPAAAGFAFRDEPGQYLEVLSRGRPLARYMHAYDKATPQRLLETYKPYLHVLDPEGKTPITKGPGGLYPHHRGIFIGWNKIGFRGKLYDRWHMKGGEQVHQGFALREATGAQASLTSRVQWNDEGGGPILEEERTLRFRPGTGAAYASIDFESALRATVADVLLDGDPEHAGVHFRPADELDKKQTKYLFPKEDAVPTKDLDYPWVAEAFSLADKRYGVVLLNHPQNPTGTRFSAYRDYGRFGAFAKAALKQGEALTLRYRFLILAGELPERAVLDAAYREYSAEPTPSR